VLIQGLVEHVNPCVLHIMDLKQPVLDPLRRSSDPGTWMDWTPWLSDVKRQIFIQWARTSLQSS